MSAIEQEIQKEVEIDGDVPGGKLIGNIDPAQLITSASTANIARYNPEELIGGHGWRGCLRALQVVGTFVLYNLFVYVYHRGWFVGKKDELEERHLQWQAEWLHRQLLRLG